MDQVEKARELLIKHLYRHGGDGLGITDRNVYMAVLDAVQEALNIPDVHNRRGLLIAFLEWYHLQENHNNDGTIKQVVDDYLGNL